MIPRSVFAFLLFLVVSAVVMPFAAAQNPADSLIFLESHDAAGKVVHERMVTCLNLLVRDLNLAGKPLPAIVVIHASPAQAKAAGIGATTVAASTPQIGPRSYVFWIVGKPSYAQYASALYNVLANYYAVRLSHAERQEVITRAVRFLENTISAHAD